MYKTIKFLAAASFAVLALGGCTLKTGDYYRVDGNGVFWHTSHPQLRVEDNGSAKRVTLYSILMPDREWRVSHEQEVDVSILGAFTIKTPTSGLTSAGERLYDVCELRARGDRIGGKLIPEGVEDEIREVFYERQ